MQVLNVSGKGVSGNEKSIDGATNVSKSFVKRVSLDKSECTGEFWASSSKSRYWRYPGRFPMFFKLLYAVWLAYRSRYFPYPSSPENNKAIAVGRVRKG